MIRFPSALASLFLLLCSGLAIPATAGTPVVQTPPAQPMDLGLFRAGGMDLQIVSGPLFSLQPTHSARPNFDYELTAIRFGYMLDTPGGHGFFRGNDELLLEGSVAPIFQGPGTAIGGWSLLYRRNFVQPGSHIIPYFDVSGGGVYTDIYHDHIQRAIGSPLDFNLGASVGVRFLLGDSRWSIDVEAAYRHISDASLTPRNDGIDAIGALLGLSRTF